MKDNDSFVCYPTEQMGYVPGGIAIEPSTNPDLPKGCSPLECKKLVRQPLKEVHFAGDDIQRAFQIMQSFKLPTGHLVPIKVRTSIEECNLVLPEGIVSQLTGEEQARAKEFVPPIQVSYEPPVMYRFIGKEYIDRFFETGELQLSTFNRCKTAEVGGRSDTGEGICTFVGIMGDQTVETVVGAGGNPLMLCFSLGVNARHDKYDGSIVVHDFPRFMMSITEELVKKGVPVLRVMHGPCTYSERLIVKRGIREDESMSQFVNAVSGNKSSFDFDLLRIIANQIGGVRNYFTKPPCFSDEQEYRMVWDCADGYEGDVIKVNLDKKVVEMCCDRAGIGESTRRQQ